jgi:hypothetical protein
MKKFLIALLCFAAAIPACVGTKSIYKLADTPTQYVKVVLIHHNALGAEVVRLRADPTISQASKDRLLAGYRVTVCAPTETGPIALCKNGPTQQLEAAGRAYEAIHDAKTEKEMSDALTKLVGLMSTLINLVNGAK